MSAYIPVTIADGDNLANSIRETMLFYAQITVFGFVYDCTAFPRPERFLPTVNNALRHVGVSCTTERTSCPFAMKQRDASLDIVVNELRKITNTLPQLYTHDIAARASIDRSIGSYNLASKEKLTFGSFITAIQTQICTLEQIQKARPTTSGNHGFKAQNGVLLNPL